MKDKTRLVYGAGINDANYQVARYEMVNDKRRKVWCCPFYVTWSSMIERCYSEKSLVKRPSYKGCTVCEEWLTFSNFRAWMAEQQWQDEAGKKLQLDKDLISGTNRGKLYSPETCVFVSSDLNNFLVSEQSGRSGLPLGVARHPSVGEKYRVQVNNPFTGKREHVGLFNTVSEAVVEYNNRKKEIAAQYAEIVTDPKLKKILLDFKVHYA